jgi:hypothetical protein
MIFFTPASTRTLRSRITRLFSTRILVSTALALGGGVSAIVIGVSPGLADTAATGPTGPTGPAGPPGESVCLSRRVVTIHWRLHPNVEVGRFTVAVNGATYKTLPASARRATVKLTEMEGPETVTVQIRARTLTGVTLKNTRIYHTCVPAGAPHNAPDLYLGP